jgi:glycosyltransferase involved in cell wall biosynthesis/SAM-dependent methyltransferase/uncharacterized coiled-coil protein SlyX
MSFDLTEAGYVLDDITDVWSRPGYCGIAYNDGDEIEERIGAVISEANDLGVLSNELRSHCTDWPSLYHLTSARANILRPFEADLQGEILEIGAGCGAITRFLGECGGNVLALEGSPRRAAIARSRTRELPNVAVVSDRFDLFQRSWKFDVITLIGVLEYANLFNAGVNPALAMLEQVQSLLKPDGKLIIAIENQFGLKYFAGAPEDHLSIPMYGIEGRYRKEQPQTFGRRALTRVLEQAGFSHSEFLAAFPDYKLPFSIITEKGFSCDDFDAGALASQSVRRDPQLPPILTFSPELVWHGLVENRMALDMANSFLVVARRNHEQSDSNDLVLAWHFTSERSKEFCKKTEFRISSSGEIKLHCQPLLPDMANHCQKQLLRWDISDDSPYAIGKPLSQDFIDIVSRDGWKIEDVGEFLRRYLKMLTVLVLTPAESAEIEAADFRLPGVAFDYIPQNIIVFAGGGFQVIDKEWGLNTDTTAGQLVFRGLLAMLGLVTRFGFTSSKFTNTPLGFVSAAFQATGLSVTEREIMQYMDGEMAIQAEVSGGLLNAEDRIDWFSRHYLPRANSSQAIAERDGQIAGLNQTVAERVGQIDGLNKAVAERDGQIAGLNQALAERDGQITGLNQALGERDGQIDSLNRALGERDGQIDSLNRAVAERDDQIDGLNQAVAERDDQIAGLNQAVAERDGQIAGLNRAVAEQDTTLRQILDSTSWRLTMPMRAMSQGLRTVMRHAIRQGRSWLNVIQIGVSLLRFAGERAVYWRKVNQRWPAPKEIPRLVRNLIRLHSARSIAETSESDSSHALRSRLNECADALPSISVVMPVYKTPLPLLGRAIQSVLDQIFWKWELCICDDGSEDQELQRALQHWANTDSRIQIYTLDQNSGISSATNAAMKHATGDYVAFLDHDDELTSDALAEIALAISEDPCVDVIYTDQDKIDSSGVVFEPFYKPDWSPDYFRRVMYVGHLLVVRRSLVDTVNGLNERFNRVQDYEFMLRVSEVTNHIQHIPKILYHWRATQGSIAASLDAKGKIEELQSDAVREHLQRMGLKAEVSPNPAYPHRVSIRYKRRAGSGRVSIVIPTKDHPEHIGRCLASIYDNSKGENVEVVVVDNGTSDPDALAILRQYPVLVVPYNEPFNYSKANNLGVAASSGSIIALLNNDTEVISGDWLDILVGNLEQDDVGAVGPVLLYPDSTVQHAGIVLGPRGTADHVMRGFRSDWDGYAGSLSSVREVTGVTGACLFTRKKTYEELGGLVEHYATHYQDVDYCLRLRKKGLRILCVPDVKLIHHESATRGDDYDVLDRLLLQDLWASELKNGDPYYNPEFSLTALDYSVANKI